MQHSSPIRQKLTNLLLKISQGEREIEVLRQSLCEQDSFESYAAFKRIERSVKGSLGVSDIRDLLNDNKFSHIEEFILAFLQHYDYDSDTRLNYQEFLKVVLPAANPILRSNVVQRPNYRIDKDQPLPYQVEYALAKLINREIAFYSELNSAKVSLTLIRDFSYKEAFSLLDLGRLGKVSFASLMDYFQEEGIFPNDEDVKAILRRLDKDNDGFVNYHEFVEAVRPCVEPKTQKLSVESSKPTNLVVRSSPLKETLKGSPRIHPKTEKALTTEDLNPLARTVTSEWRATSPLRSGSKYANKTYSERARRILEQDVSPEIDARLSARRRSRAREEEEQHEGRMASPNLAKGIYTSHSKRSEASRSPLRRKVSEERIRRSAEREAIHRKEGMIGSLSGTKRSLERQMNRSSSHKKRTAEKEKIKGVDDLEDKNYRILIDVFKQFLFLDKEIEDAKKVLDLQMDFNLLDAFKTFDLTLSGVVTCHEILEAMKVYGVYPDKRELYLFMRRFDREGHEELTFKEFSNIFRPRHAETFDLMTKRTPINPDEKLKGRKGFAEDTKKLIAKVLNLHLENESSSEILRQMLQKRSNLNLRVMFKRIDKGDDGFFTISKLKRAFEENKIFVLDKDLDLLMERLDVNGDGKVSYLEFMQELTPKCQ